MKKVIPLKNMAICVPVAFLLHLSVFAVLGTTTVSTPPSPRLSSSTPPAESWSMILSPNGNFGVFHSLGIGLTQDQTDPGIGHLYLRVLPKGPTRLLTRPKFGQKLADGSSIALALSGNGRYLLALSDATNLTTNTVTGGNNLFRLDLDTGLWQLVNHDIDRTSASGKVNAAQITSDGRFILFTSANKSLGNFPPTVTGNNLLLSDMETGKITIESDFDGGGYDNVTDFVLSPDGNNGVYIPAPLSISPVEPLLLVVRDFKTHTGERTTQGTFDRTHTIPISISQDGRFYFLAKTGNRTDRPFFSLIRREFGTTNLTKATASYPTSTLPGTPVLSTTNGSRLFFSNTNGIVYWEAETSTNLVPVSTVATNGSPANSWPYAVSDDGNKLLYGSNVDPTGALHTNLSLYLTDIATGQITPITHPLSQDSESESFANAVMDSLGRQILFDSVQPDYVTDDLNRSHDLFEFDVESSAFTLLTPKAVNGPEPRAPGYTRMPAQSVNDDGSYCIFFSVSPALLQPYQATNLCLFGQNLLTGQRELLSVDITGLPATSPVLDAVLSRDGKFVLMLTAATNLASRYAPYSQTQLILHDIKRKTNYLVSADEGYDSAHPFSSSILSYAMSGDGRRVVYSTSRNTSLMLYDRLNDRVDRAVRDLNRSEASVTIRAWSLSPDGRGLAFISPSYGLSSGVFDNAPYKLYIRDLTSETNRRLPFDFEGFLPTIIKISDDSTLLTLSKQQNEKVAIIDIPTGTNISRFQNASDPVVSKDRQYAAYLRSMLVGMDSISYTSKQVYLTYLPTGETRLVSRAYGQPDVPALGSCGAPSFSSDGAWLTFASTASNLTEYTPSGFPQIYEYNIHTDMLLIASAASTTKGGANSASGSLRMSRNSDTLFFTSGATDLQSDGQPSGVTDLYQTELRTDLNRPRDSEGDGLPDWWEYRYYGDLFKTKSDKGTSGVSVRQEYEQNVGIFRSIQIQASFDNATGELQITFPSIVGRPYRIENTSDLSNTAWPNSSSTIIATETTTTFVGNPQQDIQAQSTVYYRVVQVN